MKTRLLRREGREAQVRGMRSLGLAAAMTKCGVRYSSQPLNVWHYATLALFVDSRHERIQYASI